jgi:hypothetical protein
VGIRCEGHTLGPAARGGARKVQIQRLMSGFCGTLFRSIRGSVWSRFRRRDFIALRHLTEAIPDTASDPKRIFLRPRRHVTEYAAAALAEISEPEPDRIRCIRILDKTPKSEGCLATSDSACP